MAKWDQITSSGDVEDRRGDATPVGIGAFGTLIVIGTVLLFGGDASQVQSILGQLQQGQTTTPQGQFVDTKEYKQFAQKILGSNDDVWTRELAKSNIDYIKPKLVLFRQFTESSCGGANSASGPHYCPRDQTIYLDETFFEELKTRFGAKGGDVAEAYVIAHEVGHHVQMLKGTFANVDTRNNQNSVKVELQADCYAGVWAGDVASEGIINESEIQQAIDAAEVVGDDRIQKTQGRQVNPETWTHGSSAERKKWFLTGYRTKESNACNTIG
jgi:uncharacterized protein